MAEVVGAAFLGLTKHVKEQKGVNFLNAVVEDAGDTTKAIFAKRIIMLDWYPYSSYAGFLRALDRKLGKGDLTYCHELGMIAAQRDAQTIYSLYKEKAKPEQLIRDCSFIWQNYYRNAGRMEAVSWEPDNSVVRIYDFPDMDPAHCLLMVGWMRGMMHGVGAQVTPESREIMCMSHGAPYHEFKCNWTLQPAR